MTPTESYSSHQSGLMLGHFVFTTQTNGTGSTDNHQVGVGIEQYIASEESFTD